jgi:hypothetical protein
VSEEKQSGNCPNDNVVMCEYPLVLIKWVDSYGCGSAWGCTEDLEPRPHYCYSVGWIVKETKDVVVVVPHFSPKNDRIEAVESGCGDMTIPRVAIVEQTKLNT